MRNWFFSLRALAICWSLAAALLFAHSSPAQVRIPEAALPHSGQLQQVLEHGQRLESEQRWGEALAHYENALRETPGMSGLEERLALARAHYDLQRRYGDPSFTQVLTALSDREALDAYSEVLLKIQSHYVDSPNWAELIRRGALSFEVALGETWFAERSLPHASPQAVEEFRRYLNSAVAGSNIRNRHEARQFVSQMSAAARDRLGLPLQAAAFEFTCGAVSALDAYSSYLTPDQLDEVMSQIEGNFVGLGIELKSDDKGLLIVHVIEGGPAALAGVKRGDHIVAVDGQSVVELSTDNAADLLKGPEGSTVLLDISDARGAARRVTLQRRVVDVPSIEGARIVDAEWGIAYLRLTSFQKTTGGDVDAALWALHRQGMRSLIVDVRGNPGGLLTAAVDVADRFIERGAIVATRGRSLREDNDYQAQTAGTWRVPLAVLVDQDSASASEIFAGAIRDHRRGVIIGQRSYGKGSVQGIFPLSAGGAGIRLTTAKFYSPSGQPISHRGVEPDVVVRVAARPNVDDLQTRGEESQDEELSAAIRVFRERFTSR